MSTISVCIPSYKRPDRVKTLKVAPFASLYVDESEEDEYRRCNPGARVVSMPSGVQGNIARVRNWILDHEGSDAVCMMDDDITQFGEFVGRTDYFGYVRRRIEGEDFARFLERNTALCEDLGLHLWGVNVQAANRLYHQGIPFSLTKPVLGPFSVHVRSEVRYDESMPLKEDYDLFLSHLLKYRGVLRLNMAWYANGGSKGAKGGCASMRSTSEESRQLGMLERKWGSKVVGTDRTSKKGFDFNPKLNPPLRGV